MRAGWLPKVNGTEHTHLPTVHGVGVGATSWCVAKRSKTYHEITTKPLDLPRNTARFCNSLLWFAAVCNTFDFTVNHEFLGP